MSYHTIEMEGNNEEPAAPVLLSKHAKYLLRFLHLLPARLSSHDSTRSTIVFFAVCGLDVLNSLHLLSPQMRRDIIDWIYGGLVTPRDNERPSGGFMGSRSVLISSDDIALNESIRCYQWGHVAMTYTSLAVLVTLGDDLSRLNRKSIVDGVAAVQRPDGSFSACIDGSENDMRFVYCAATICHILDYWGDIDREAMYQYIIRSLRYDNGFSQHLESEAHGGTTFCALAALDLSGQLNRLDAQTVEGIKRWLVFRQIDGFQGRPNKPVDTCYSFWIGASLRMLNSFELTNFDENRKYILETQDNIIGGFAKWPQSSTDPFHTYLGLCGLSFTQEPGIGSVMPSLNISTSAYEKLKKLHEQWRRGSDSALDMFASSSNDSVATTPGDDSLNLADENETITSPLIKAQ